MGAARVLLANENNKKALRVRQIMLRTVISICVIREPLTV